jgi:3-oxoacyl-[acyl-carrier protein] reductase
MPQLSSGIPGLKEGARILIAGASGGIGREVVRHFCQCPVKIGAHCFKSGPTLESIIAARQPCPASVQIFHSRVTRPAECSKLVRSFVEWAGGLDVLVQLTGSIHRPVSWNEITEEDWDRDLGVNLKGPFFLAQAAMAAMTATGGRIILTSTASARHGGGPNSMIYGLAKAGIEYLVKALARVGAPHNILVNAIAPGLIKTAFHTVRLKRTREQLARRADLVPLKRAGSPREVAGVIAFLASDSASYLTGECINVSGGDWL